MTVDLTALRAALDAATQGERELSPLGTTVYTPRVPGAPVEWVALLSNRAPEDAAYIVAAQPRAVLALLDEIERLRGARAEAAGLIRRAALEEAAAIVKTAWLTGDLTTIGDADHDAELCEKAAAAVLALAEKQP